MKQTQNTALELDLTPRAPWGAMMGRAFHALINNPSLLVPPMFVGLAHLSLYAVFAWMFFTSMAAKMSALRYSVWDMNSVRLVQVLLRISWPYMLAVLGLLVLARLLIGTFHNAGWSAMFASAARTGRASLVDYGYGVFMHSPRFLGAVAVKMAAHAIPVLFVMIMMLLLSKAGHVPRGSLLVIALPFAALVAAVEAALGLLFMFWRQSLTLENAGAAESLARSFAFVRLRLGDVVRLVGLWIVYGAVVNLFFMLLGAVLMQAVTSGTPQAMGLRAVLYLNTTLLSWLFHFVGMVFFVLLGFVLYHDRMVAPFEQDGDAPPQEISLSLAMGEDSVSATGPQNPGPAPDTEPSAEPVAPEPADASDHSAAPPSGEPLAPDAASPPEPAAPADDPLPEAQAEAPGDAEKSPRAADDADEPRDPGAPDL